jgi:hypothetical protein
VIFLPSVVFYTKPIFQVYEEYFRGFEFPGLSFFYYWGWLLFQNFAFPNSEEKLSILQIINDISSLYSLSEFLALAMLSLIMVLLLKKYSYLYEYHINSTIKKLLIYLVIWTLLIAVVSISSSAYIKFCFFNQTNILCKPIIFPRA